MFELRKKNVVAISSFSDLINHLVYRLKIFKYFLLFYHSVNKFFYVCYSMNFLHKCFIISLRLKRKNKQQSKRRGQSKTPLNFSLNHGEVEKLPLLLRKFLMYAQLSFKVSLILVFKRFHITTCIYVAVLNYW